MYIDFRLIVNYSQGIHQQSSWGWVTYELRDYGLDILEI